MAIPNVSLPNFEWGEYTPTLTIVANLDSVAIVAASARFMRMGDVTHVFLAVTADPTAAAPTSFDISLPIASNFTAAGDCNGVANTALAQAGYVSANTTDNRARVTWTAGAGTATGVTIVFTYRNL